MNIIDAFNAYSQDYDGHRRQFIPCFDVFYQSAVSLLSFDTDTPKILDVGAGTGLLSAFILSKYPKAEITLIDQADSMLKLAQNRFANMKQIRYLVADYTTHPFTEAYDAIVSALSIHHLDDKQKETFYQKCFSHLKDEGIFVNADQVLSLFPAIEENFIALWHDFVKKSQLPTEALEAYYRRTAYDKTTPLQTQLDWLLKAGFKQGDCIFKYLNFAVFFANK